MSQRHPCSSRAPRPSRLPDPTRTRPLPETDLTSSQVPPRGDLRVYRICLREATDEGLLADYRIAGIVITDEDLRRALNRRSSPTWTAEGLRTAAGQVALLSAQRLFDLRRTLSFHPSIAAAEVSAETLPETAALMPDGDAPLHVGTVSSRQSSFERQQNFDVFASFTATTLATAPLDSPPRRAVLTNCRCCAEGVDIPAIDSLLFAHPKTISIDIVQCIGRALRQTPGDGKISTIIIPIYMAPGESLEEATKKSAFHLLYQVLIKLDVYDEHRVYLINDPHWREEPPVPELAARPERADEIIPVLDLTHVMSPNRVWEAAFEIARSFHADHGHLDVRSLYTHDRFYLGWWVGQQRSLRKNNLLLPKRIAALDTLDMIWEHPQHSIERKLLIARDYAARHGHLAPRWNERHNGMHLGRWVADRRKEARARTLPFCYQRALKEIYPWWDAAGPADWKRTYARALAAARNGTLPFPGPDPLPHTDPPLTHWLAQQIEALPALRDYQQELLAVLPLQGPLSLLLRRPRGAAQWAFARGLRAAYLYRRSHHHLDVPYRYVCPDASSLPLGRWLADKRHAPQQLTQDQIRALEALDMRWIPRQQRPTN